MTYLAKQPIWGLLVVGLLAGCILQEPTSNYRNIKPVTSAGLNVKLNLNEYKDTVYITYPLWINYNVDDLVHPMDSSTLYIDDKPVYSSTTNTIYFYFDISKFSLGAHHLKVTASVKSGSGSLGDNLGVEQVKVVTELIAIFGPPPTLKITQIDTTNGVLGLHWEKYKMGNFQSYVILKASIFGLSSTVVKEITSPDITYVEDPDYVGGDFFYLVVLKAGGISQNGNARQVSWHPKFHFQTDNAKTSYYWEKPRFYRATTGINFNNVADLLVTDTVYQGGPIDYLNDYVTVSLSFKSASGPVLVASQMVYKGKLLATPSVSPLNYNSKDSIYYGTNLYPDRTVVMAKNFNVMTEVNGKTNLFISPNGKYTLMRQLGTNNLDHLSLVDSKTLAVTNSSIGSFPSFDGVYPVSNNGFFAVRQYNTVNVYSLSNGKSLFGGTPSSNSYTPFTLSPNGNYVIFSNSLYAYNGFSFQYSNTLPVSTNNIVGFDKDDNIIVAAKSGTNIAVANPLTGATIKTFNTNYPINQIAYDIYSDLILVNGQNVVDLSNAVQKQFSTTQSQLTLLNGKLFYQLGSGTQFLTQDAKPF